MPKLNLVLVTTHALPAANGRTPFCLSEDYGLVADQAEVDFRPIRTYYVVWVRNAAKQAYFSRTVAAGTSDTGKYPVHGMSLLD